MIDLSDTAPRASRLALTASLKAAHLSSDLSLMQASVKFVATRILIQNALRSYNEGTSDEGSWSRAGNDLETALDGNRETALRLQAVIKAKDADGPRGSESLIEATAVGSTRTIALPYARADGSQVYLGDADMGYPPSLYPNLTYVSRGSDSTAGQSIASFEGQELDESSTLLLGPLQLNETTALLSITVPVVNNTLAADILGWLTVVMDAQRAYRVLESPEGLDETGVALLLGPTTKTNHFPPGVLYDSNNDNPPARMDVNFIFPLTSNETDRIRRKNHRFGVANPPFDYATFPAVKKALTERNGPINNAGSMFSTNNEEGVRVAVGYAVLQSEYCDWILILEQAHSEAWSPIQRLRVILLACVFGTLG